MVITLPDAPGFPVYGLSDRVEGLRWLCTWQRWPTLEAGDLWEVCLGHGDPREGPYALVTTTTKQLPWPESAHGPQTRSGVVHAATSAIHNLVGRSLGREADEADEADEEARMVTAELERFSEIDGVAHFAGWQSVTVLIDGVRQGARLRRLPNAWAFVLELDDVVVTAWSTDDVPFELVELRDVSGDLGSIELLPARANQ